MTISGSQPKMAEPGRSLLDDLRRPEAYPDPRPSAVTLVTTHISWVFLTDREVWKLKRPVDYGFVDYTTVERRRQFCEDEVRLNRRLAPDVYLGVVAVRLGPAGHWFGPDGEIVDYAVRMRRLPDDRSMEALLRRGALTGEHLQRLASRLARFFTAAAPVPEAGAIEAIRGPVTENFVEVEPFVGRFVSREVLDAVRDWQLGTLERESARFEERVRQGRIRDGHGDLRLEHVYFEAGEPIAIDCVEFSSRLRSGDAAGDVAFLAMELAARSRRDLGERFLAEFARESDDLGEEALAEVPARPRSQLHREEGHVPRRVPVLEARAELDAVDGDRVAVLEVAMLEPEVAVAVPDATLRTRSSKRADSRSRVPSCQSRTASSTSRETNRPTNGSTSTKFSATGPRIARSRLPPVPARRP